MNNIGLWIVLGFFTVVLIDIACNLQWNSVNKKVISTLETERVDRQKDVELIINTKQQIKKAIDDMANSAKQTAEDMLIHKIKITFYGKPEYKPLADHINIKYHVEMPNVSTSIVLVRLMRDVDGKSALNKFQYNLDMKQDEFTQLVTKMYLADEIVFFDKKQVSKNKGGRHE